MIAPFGQIISFYSYKGGAGRSLAVANIAALLALRTEPKCRVLIIDWDLEAPGLHAYFPEIRPKPDEPPPSGAQGREPQQDAFARHSRKDKQGILGYFEAISKHFASDPGAYGDVLLDRSSLDRIVPLDEYIEHEVFAGLDAMWSDPLAPNYRAGVAEFDWARFWQHYPAAIHAFRERLAKLYDYVLIDSRTGYSDTGGLCSAILPEKLVLVFTLNQQSLDGSLSIARRSVDFRVKSDDVRPLAIYPLASRVDFDAEMRDREVWLRRFEDRFEDCFREIYATADCRLSDYFRMYFVRHNPFYSYGEKLAVLVEDVARSSGLRSTFETFTSCLTESEYAWQPASEWRRSPRL